jgi:tRNA pseudouridine13 synthase
MTVTTIGRLLPGAANFRVTELPAYAACGQGEHLYVEIEKEGMTTDAAVQVVARATGLDPRAVGFAGRKDRHGITRQWLSLQFGNEAGLASLEQRTDAGARLRVVSVSRHKNKLKPGHLAGNRFSLGVEVDDPATATARLADLGAGGIPNRFGTQRFGVNGSSLALAKAWGVSDWVAAAAICVDPDGGWKPGDPLPGGFRYPPEGLVLAALRKEPEAYRNALRRGGDQLRKLAASAAQSAIFNAILDARIAAGLLHRLRPGDLAHTIKGAPFTVTPADLDDVNRRAAPGVLDVVATGPLPGTWRLVPSPEVLAEERAWSAATGIDWAWMGDGGTLESPGDRRPLVTRFREPPVLTTRDGATWLEFALPSGAYATEVLGAVGIAVPERRAG